MAETITVVGSGIRAALRLSQDAPGFATAAAEELAWQSAAVSIDAAKNRGDQFTCVSRIARLSAPTVA
jgi:hypothetical protein